MPVVWRRAGQVRIDGEGLAGWREREGERDTGEAQR
jgi:hypothetical protein